jgi:alpha-D-ribose 1-methylphosphonate 5-triphosphate synthase subunit PhnH
MNKSEVAALRELKRAISEMSAPFKDLTPQEAAVKIVCADCDVSFWVTANFDKNRVADMKRFYCPNGHSLSYKQSKNNLT